MRIVQSCKTGDTRNVPQEFSRAAITISDMARFSRVVALDVPHHVTQRGNNRQTVFHSDSDRWLYLDLRALWMNVTVGERCDTLSGIPSVQVWSAYPKIIFGPARAHLNGERAD